MKAILKRELSSYFNSAIAYVVMAMFFGFSGWFFIGTCFMANSSSLSPTFSNIFVIIVFITPIISMKSFSEEKRQRTDQALLTSPSSLFEIVMGKFLGAFLLYVICCMMFFVYGLVIMFFAPANWAVIICTNIGLMLLGGALIAIDVFISALTESQLIAAIIGMAVGLITYMTGSISSMIGIDWVTNVLNSISFTSYYANFTYGMLDLTGVVFFLSVIALFIFFTIRVFEKKRWS
ncbi:MAG: ABC transporter permease subunit [Ruminococcus sp.]|jgi:ABC-2 type transport system permease protein|nr:ABC transporter permease subunit [Ruminococcus sp.]